MALLTRDESRLPSRPDHPRRDPGSPPTPGKPCVSIYMPTVRAGAEAQQNPIRFKNLLRSSMKNWRRRAWRAPTAAELMAPVRDLVDDPAFWQEQGDGLVVFRSPDVSADLPPADRPRRAGDGGRSAST